jgi:hypothetical protein
MKVEKGLVKLTELISMTTEGTFNNGGNLSLNRGKSNPNSEGDTGNKIVTKLEVITPYFVNLNRLSGYTLNQLPPYEDIRPGGDCGDCYSFDVTITQADINDSSNGKVYVYYYSCGTYSGDTMDYMSFSYPGTFKNYICVQNCAYLPPLVYIRNSNGTISYATKGSNVKSLDGNCETVKLDCGTSTFTYEVTRPGLTILGGKVDLGQTYGNVPVTISYNSYNPKNEIFIGNYDEKIGEVFTSTYGITYEEEVVGFQSTKSKQTIDIVIFSSSDTVFIPFTITFTVGCPTTLDCDTDLAVKTYVTNTSLQVTQKGYIKYETKQDTVYYEIKTTGMVTLTDCFVYESLDIGIPFANVATYTVLNSGYTCNASLTDCSNITFVSNSDTYILVGWTTCSNTWRTRTLVPGEIFSVCGLINSGYGSGASISYGSGCDGDQSTPTPSDIYYNNTSYPGYIPIWFTNTLNNNNVCGGGYGSPISCYYTPGLDFFSPPSYIFSDAAGTPFTGFNYVSIGSSYGSFPQGGYEYNTTTGKVGIKVFTCL